MILARKIKIEVKHKMQQQWYIARLGPPTSMEKASMEKQGVLCDGNDEGGVAVTPHFPVVQILRLWKEQSIRFHTF